MKFDIYTQSGEKKGQVDGNARIFEANVNMDLMHRAVVMRLANKRNPIAHTLTRGEVSKTTAKAFRQKGTGRARRGSLSTNLLKGGGVAHGPRNTRNFTKAMPKKERRAALFSALSLKAPLIIGLESFTAKVPKTKDFVEMVGKLPEGKKRLFVIAGRDENFQKSARNIPGVEVIWAQYLNPYDILKAEQIIICEDAFDKIEQTFLGNK